MKFTAIFCLLFCLAISVGCQNQIADSSGENPDPTAVKSPAVALTNVSNQTVEASCGQCQFNMEGKGCELAVRIDGKFYYVDGAAMDDHGDAHSDDGMCNCIRHAKVSGEIKDGRFLSTSFELLPQEKQEGNAKADLDHGTSDNEDSSKKHDHDHDL